MGEEGGEGRFWSSALAEEQTQHGICPIVVELYSPPSFSCPHMFLLILWFPRQERCLEAGEEVGWHSRLLTDSCAGEEGRTPTVAPDSGLSRLLLLPPPRQQLGLSLGLDSGPSRQL